MSDIKPIKTALVSVFHKDGLDELLKTLHEQGVAFLSTGGTQQFIESLGYPCQKVEDVTTYPSILGGRIIDALGRPYDKKGPLQNDEYYPAIAPAPDPYTRKDKKKLILNIKDKAES